MIRRHNRSVGWVGLSLLLLLVVSAPAAAQLDDFKNFSKATLASGINNSATTLTLLSGGAARMPAVSFNAVIWNATDYPDPSDDPNREVVRVTNISSETLTITRAQESTVAATHNTGGKTYQIIATLTAKTLTVDIPNMSGAPINAPYWLSTANGTLSNEVNIGALSAGALGITISGGTATPVTRTLTGTTNEISVANGTMSGTPTFSLAALVDLSAKGLKLPSSTSLPGTCATGQIYMDTDATSGQRIYACESTNTWVKQGDGGGGGGATDLDGLSDVAISGLATGDVLISDNGTSFHNRPFVTADISDASELSFRNANDVLGANSSNDGVEYKTLTQPAAGLTITHSANTVTFALANDLAALEGLSSNGIAARTGTSTWSVRTNTGTSNEITITNGDGVSGNPTYALSTLVDLSSKGLKLPSSTSLPGTCATGQIYMDTDATSGQRIYACESTNTWVLEGDGGSGGGGSGDWVSTLVNSEIAITSATTATISRQHLVSGTSANYTVNLPAASGNTGKFIGIRIASTATKLFTIDANGSETIDGALTRIMWAGESALLYCDGANWSKVAGKTIPMRAAMRITASQNILDTTLTKVSFDATDVDNTGTMADTSGHVITARRPGDYAVSATMYIQALTTGPITRGLAQVGKGGSSNNMAYAEATVAFGGFLAISANATVTLASGDTLELDALQTSGATQPLIVGALNASSNLLSATEIPSW